MKLRNKTSLCAAVLLSAVGAYGQTSHTAAVPPLVLSGVETQAAYAVDLQTGAVLWDYNGARRLTPASITKLFSTAAALEQKGGDARFRTALGFSADSLTLVVHGCFDPTTDSRYFAPEQMALAADTLSARLRVLGVSHLRSLTADLALGLFSPHNSKRLWEDMGNGYGASPTCLAADDNTADVYLHSPAGLNELCTVDSVIPSPGKACLTSYVRTYEGKGDATNIYCAGPSVWYATGGIPAGQGSFRVRSVLPEPEAHFIDKLRKLLSDNGIETDTIVLSQSRPQLPDEKEILSLWSPTMREIAQATNVNSINLFADALMFSLSLKKNSDAAAAPNTAHATWSGATENLKKYWEERLGFKPFIFDGSGLSTMGALSPKELTALLRHMNKSKAADDFCASLPVWGQSGTLKSLPCAPELRNRIHAKSGSMTGVLSYAGYIDGPANDAATNKNKRRIAFCIIVNHHAENNYEVRRQISLWLKKIAQTSTTSTNKKK